MRKLFRRLSALIHRRRLRRELDEEMEAHLEMMPAERQQRFGSTLRLHEDAADQWGWAWLDQLRQDLAYGARSLVRSPGFTLTAIAVLTLGIGVNVAEFQLFLAFLNKLHVRDVDSLCRFYRITRNRAEGGFSVPETEFYRRHNTALSTVITETDARDVCSAEDAAPSRCSLVSGNFFRDLGIAPAYGRLLDEQDDQTDSPPVAVLSYDYWRSRFGGDPAAVNQTIRLNAKPVQVVGIVSPEFGGLVMNASIWLTTSQYPYLTGDTRLLADYGSRRTYLFGRLKPGITMKGAEERFRPITAELRRRQPEHVEEDEWLKAQPPAIPPTSDPRAVLLLSTCALLVLLVLFSACANLGNMLLARGMVREREIEIRLAIGAGRARLIRQLMTENLLLAVLASMAALVFGKLASTLLLRVVNAPSAIRVVTDWRIVLACGALGLLATLAFGLVPAFHAVKRGRAPSRARKALIAVQVAVSCVLLILSSFFTRGVQQIYRTEVTFDFRRLTLIDPALYYLQRNKYPPARARQALEDMASRLRGLPGVEAVALTVFPPIRRSTITQVSGQSLYMNAVDPSYFAMMRVPLLEGRLFRPDEHGAVVISESAARRLWPRESPLGKTCLIWQGPHTVIGVVRDSGANLISHPESVEAYIAIDDKTIAAATILVSTTSDPAPMAPAMRSAVSVPGVVPSVSTYASILEQQRETLRKTVTLVGSVGAVASWLAMIGIFGLLAFTVAQKTREIGVRMALGARPTDVLREVLGPFVVPFGCGAILGIAGAAAATKILRNLVYGYVPLDVLSFGAGLLLFATVAVAAALVPARRALRVDPASALRYE